jgi:pimeloyl-ACP methyl ester carboxylesterase
MRKIFLISGLGADTRLYNNIDLLDNEVVPVDWIEPHVTDTLATYAQKLINQYYIISGSIVIGTSLGGMIAIEMAKQVALNKVILISSIKTINEAPWYFNAFRRLPLYRHMSGEILKKLGFLMKPVFGKFTADDLWVFEDMLKRSSSKFVKWAIGAVLAWKNETIPQNVYHLIGDKDMVFSYTRIKDATIIKGGTHIMIFDKAKQINKILKGILKKK